jgi:hypothetical protein
MAAPNAPIWVSPANLAYLNAAAGLTIQVAFSDPDVGDTMTYIAIRRRVAGAGTYQYWDGAAWQTTIQWIANTTGIYTFGAGAWVTSTAYQIAVNTKDAAGNVGSFNAERLINASTPPVFDLTGPASPVGTSRPTATWTYTDTEGHAMSAYRLVLYPSTVYGQVGFDPQTWTAQAVWDSGVVSTATTPSSSAQIGYDVQQGVTYRLYGWAWQTGDQQSNVDYQQFTVNLTQPNAPTLTAAPDTTNARNQLDLLINLNLLSATDANMESGVGSWIVEDNVLMTSSSAWVAQGTLALALVVGPTIDDVDATYTTMDDVDTAFAGQTMDQLDSTFF